MVDVKAVVAKLDEVVTRLPKPVQDQLAQLEKKTGQPKATIFGAACAVVAVLLILMIPSDFMFDVVGVAYPAYASLRMLARDSLATEGPMWITYWVVFTVIEGLSPILDTFLGILPFYAYLKLAGLVYLFSPFTKGAELVLEKVLKPKVFPLLAAKAEK
eukprot:TRINITY_DN1250_c1_g1_i1.p1 TRINITY_DN1250_c1_g1~~TRINITY_DN1250_c1_g1_i1.p1  ORF type:complete len:159 (+),score=42.80 TRINITY_DN1250_c1_g1_i1:105-581(+)